MKVTLQYFEGCPSWRVANERLHTALTGVGVPVVIVYEAVDTMDKAVATGFRGSPSILIDDVDLFPDPALSIGMSCRLYETPNGLQGSPTAAQIMRALRGRADKLPGP